MNKERVPSLTLQCVEFVFAVVTLFSLLIKTKDVLQRPTHVSLYMSILNHLACSHDHNYYLTIMFQKHHSYVCIIQYWTRCLRTPSNGPSFEGNLSRELLSWHFQAKIVFPQKLFAFLRGKIRRREWFAAAQVFLIASESLSIYVWPISVLIIRTIWNLAHTTWSVKRIPSLSEKPQKNADFMSLLSLDGWHFVNRNWSHATTFICANNFKAVSQALDWVCLVETALWLPGNCFGKGRRLPSRENTERTVQCTHKCRHPCGLRNGINTTFF